MEANVYVAAAARLNGGSEHAKALLDRARKCRDRIRSRPAIWSSAMAFTVDGGIEAASGRPESAAAAWEDARKECERLGMGMYAAAAQYWKGRVSGDGAAIRNAELQFREQDVMQPEQIALMLIPGFRSSM
jgi:hypothetical protein